MEYCWLVDPILSYQGWVFEWSEGGYGLEEEYMEQKQVGKDSSQDQMLFCCFSRKAEEKNRKNMFKTVYISHKKDNILCHKTVKLLRSFKMDIKLLALEGSHSNLQQKWMESAAFISPFRDAFQLDWSYRAKMGMWVV